MGFRTLGATARAGRELSRIRLALRTGDRAAITVGAQGLIQAVGALPDGNDVRRVSLDTLHDEVKNLCDHGTAEQIDRAVLACQSAVAAAPPSDSGLLARLLVDEAMALITRFERTGVAADLVAMTDARCQAADVVPAGDPVRGQVLQIAASGLLMRFQLLHTAADLDPAIDFGRAALADDPLDRAATLSNLGLALRFRYEQRGDPADLNAAVRDGEQATTAAPADDPRLASYLSNYSSALLLRFEQLGGQGDLQAAMTASDQALAAAERDDPARVPTCLTTRAIALRFEAARSLAPADIQFAVDAARQAASRLDADPAALAEIGTPCVSNLSICLLLRYEAGGGTQDDLDEAIKQSKRAADLAAGPDAGKYLTNYGSFLLRRFQLLGEAADLSAGIDACQTAVDALPEGAPVRVRCLGNLANALMARWQRSQSADDLDRAAAAGRAALTESPADDANRGSYLNGLAQLLVLRPDGPSDGELAEAADLSAQAVAAAAAGSAEQAMFLAGRCLVMLLKFGQDGHPADLDEAVSAARQAVALTPAGHQFRALYLGRLGFALLARLGLQPNSEAESEAESAGREAAAITTAPPALRAAAAAMWGQVAAGHADWADAIEAYRTAVELLGQVAPRGLSRADQEHELAQLTGLGSRAAACCLEAGQPALAVQLLDHGRGVLLGQALDERTDLTALATSRPDLAARFGQLRDQLDPAGLPAANPALAAGPDGQQAASAAASRQAEQRRDAAGAFDALLQEVRSLAGFGRFLLPPTTEELLTASARGPVVMISVDQIRSDALVLTSDHGLRVVKLPAVSLEAVAEQTVSFLSALRAIRDAAPDADADAEASLTAVLGWLWDNITGPVLDELGLTGRPGAGKAWPRIWWSPSGLLSFLPLHAAGHHDTRFDDDPLTVLDRVASSYTATAKALLHARGQAVPELPATAGQVLVVAMEHTPGAADLTAAPQEASLLTGLFGERALVLHDQADAELATASSVLAAMPRYPWAHFACHAATVLPDPSASYLVLHDHDSCPLTVLDISRQRLQAAEFAFLSACSTASADGTLPDEAINLASAFQLAGYRRVVATMWPIDDGQAAGLARQFYTGLTTDADASTIAADAAGVLHDTVRLYRSVYAAQPSMWAAHLHAGL